MNMKTRVLTTALTATLLTTGILGCSNTNNQGSGENKKANTQTKTLNVVNGKIEPAASFTTVMGVNPGFKYREGESVTDNVFTRWAEDKFGVQIKTLWTGGATDGSYNTKLKLMLSANDELPDIVMSGSPANTNLLIDSGKFMEVEEVFEKYASPTWKSALADIKDPWLSVTRDGKKMAIPGTSTDYGQANNVLWIRQDWLDKLKLKAPTTIEELETVMDAFVNQDPDGNGQKDTFALDFAMKDKMTGSTLGDGSWIFGLYGAMPERWYPGEDGKLQNGSILPGVKQGLMKMKEWKDKGYFASDIALHDPNTIVTAVTSNKVGIVAAPSFFIQYPGSMLLATNPTAMFKPYPLPHGVNGPALHTYFTISGGTVINKDISDEALQAYFHYMNSMYAVYESDNPLEYFKGFQEGYQYVVKDGKIVTDEKEIPGGKINSNDYIFGSMPDVASKMKEITLKVAKKEELTEKDRAFMQALGIADDTNPLQRIVYDAMLISMDEESSRVREHYMGPLTSTMSARNELLQKMQMETYSKIIYGEAAVDTFDQFVEKWKSSGGDTITKEVNEWYDSVK
ncbi:extracellular solute-binding protein [Paenibacillus sonchi]|uniref:Extracellular solute-binding protein n=1 Tax=Paenibacillus sonchi TaxID=373687 RepID=A0A974PDD3_9BACL|nr:extracellular solute-binding protein [Paenibacillus sonchi]QQZ61207.1 extracellular solute-binding protein [Paenibacillus sonchi]